MLSFTKGRGLALILMQLFLLTAWHHSARSQSVSSYGFISTTEVYTTLSSGTTNLTLSSGDDAISANQTLPFNFIYGGNSFNRFQMNSNGWLHLNTGTASTSTTNTSPLNGSVNNIISAFSRDLTGASTDFRYRVDGVSPNRILKAEWINRASFTSSAVPASSQFQVWLYETSNIIEIRYGTVSAGTRTSAATVQVGLRTSSTGAANVLALGSTNSWSAPTVSNSSTATMAISTTLLPASGRVFRFGPPPAKPATPTATAPSCATGSTISATGSAPAGQSWFWQSSATGTSTSADASSPQTVFSSGIYYIRARDNSFLNWSFADSVVVSFPQSTAPATPAQSSGPGCRVTLSSDPPPSGQTNYWQGTNSNGTSSSFDATATYPVTVAGTYYLRSRDNTTNCWSSSVSVTVSTLPSFPVSITSSPSRFCGVGGSAILTVSGDPAYSYFWTTLDSAVINSGSTTASASVTVSGTSAFRLISSPDTSLLPGCKLDTSFYSVGVYPFPAVTMTASSDSICSGSSVTINSGLSAGNFSFSEIPFSSISAPASAVTLATGGVATVPQTAVSLDDGGWGNRPIGFTFNYFGTTFTSVNIGTNGTIHFGPFSAAALSDFSFTTFPSTSEPLNVIGGACSDFNFASPSGSLKHWVSGYAPNRIFVVEYNGVRAFNSSGFTTSQIRLFETTGVVEVHVASATSNNNKLVGLQNGTGTIGALALATTGAITNRAFRFEPPSNYTTVWASDTSGTNVFSRVKAPTTPGDNTYNLNFTNQTTGCSGSGSKSVFVRQTPTTPTGGTFNECSNPVVSTASVVSTSGLPDPVFKWYTTAVGGSAVQTSTSASFLGTLTGSTTFYVSEVNGTCESGRAIVTINLPAIQTPLATPTSGCVPVIINLDLTQAIPGSSVSWTGPQLNSSSGASVTASPLADASYVAIETLGSCVVVSNPVNVSVLGTGTATVSTTQATCAGTGTLSFVPAAGTNWFSSDFTSSPLPSQATLSGNAVLSSGQLELTTNLASQGGALSVLNPAGINANALKVDFDLLTSLPSANPADGLSWSYGDDVSGASPSVSGEAGSGTKLRISFDAFSNSASNPAGIYLTFGSVTTPLSGTPLGTNVLAYSSNVSWRGTAVGSVRIVINSLGQLTLTLGTTVIFNNVQLPAGYLSANKSSWTHVIAARTGGEFQRHAIDNLNIQYFSDFEYSADNGGSWQSSPVFALAPGSYDTRLRLLGGTCSVSTGTHTVASPSPLAEPSNPVGSTACLNGPAGNIGVTAVSSGSGVATYSQTITFNIGGQPANDVSPGSLLASAAFSALPAGSTVTSAVLTVNNVSTVVGSGSFRSEVRISLSGALSDVDGSGGGGAASGGTFNYTRSLGAGARTALQTTASGPINLLYFESVNDITGPDAVFSTGNTATLVINYTNNILAGINWYNVASGGNVLDTGVVFNPNPHITFGTAGTRRFYASSKFGICESANRTSVDVNVGAPINVSITANPSTTQCPGTRAVLSASVSGGGSSYTYLWSSGKTTSNDTVALSAITYFLTVTDDCGATATASYTPSLFPAVVTGSISGQTSVLTNVPAGYTFTLSGNGSGTTIQWQFSNTSPTGTYTDIASVTSNTANLIFSGSGALFLRVKVTNTATGCVGFTNVLSINISVGGNLPCDAISLSMGNQGGFNYSTAGATIDSGEVAAPANGCNVQNGWCNSTLHGTIWFKFTAPSSGRVSIAAPGWDNQLALYSVSNCANYSTYNLIAANDDAGTGNSAIITGAGCLIPGQIYYLQLDGFSGSGSASINITALGNAGPTVSNTPANITRQANCLDTVSWTPPTFTDPEGCNVTVSSNIAPGAVFPIGTTTVRYRGVDNAGYSVVASFTVTITNSAPTVLSNPGTITSVTTPGSCSGNATWTAPTFSDPEGCAPLNVSSNFSPGATFPKGTTQVTYTATDIYGSQTSSTFNVVINDTELPSLTACPANIRTFNPQVNWTPPLASDNCPGVIRTSNFAPRSIFPLGTTTVTYTATDSANNSVSCSFDVTVLPGNTYWIGSQDQDWTNPANWQGPIPSGCAGVTEATILGSAPRYPVISGTASVNNLIIDSLASLTVNGILNVCGNFTNSGNPNLGSGGTIRFIGRGRIIRGTSTADNVEIVQNTTLGGNLSVAGALNLSGGRMGIVSGKELRLLSASGKTAYIHEQGGTLSGMLTQERYISGGQGYRFLSSPVMGTTVSQWRDDFLVVGPNNHDATLELDTSRYTWPTLWRYDESQPSTNVSKGYYSYIAHNNLLNPGIGYAARLESLPVTMETRGIYRTGTVPVTITRTSSGNNSADGVNLLGNPYTEPVSWSALKAANPGKTDGSVYFYQATGLYSGQFATWNGVTGTNGGTDIISSTQGFQVIATNPTATFNFTNAARVAVLTPTFYRMGEVSNLVRIEASLNDELRDELVVYADANATDRYDLEIDALKFKSENAGMPAFYSVNGVHELTINALSELKEGKVIPLSIEPRRSGKYSFRATELNLEPGMTAYLEDHESGRVYELGTESAEIDLNAEEKVVAGRFYLVFGKPTDSQSRKISIRSDENMVVIGFRNFLQKDLDATVKIYNLLGQNIHTSEHVNSMQHTIELPVREPMTVVVEVIQAGERVSEKLIIR